MVRLPLTSRDVARGQMLGAMLRTARAHRTINSVAREAQISPETLRKIETGRLATPSFASIAALSQTLNLSLDELWRALQLAEEIDESDPAA